MEVKSAVAALAALAQDSRLAIFRLLVQTGPAGLPAGKIGAATGIAPSSLTFHLKELARANLVSSRQQGRFVIYAANYSTMNALLAFLTENCCGGSPCMPACTQPEPVSEGVSS
jgi:ArsR family transcriptional regulator, arsenate/arsenite/antimonite-responsive transcriptional repressor